MMHHDVRCQELIDRPFELVREALLANPAYVFRHATAATAANTATLRVHLGPLDISSQVDIRILELERDPAGLPSMRIVLSWSATRNRELFPTMDATIMVTATSPIQTRIALVGTYAPPLGTFGRAFDVVIGHHLVEVSTAVFMREVADWLLEELTPARPRVEGALV